MFCMQVYTRFSCVLRLTCEQNILSSSFSRTPMRKERYSKCFFLLYTDLFCSILSSYYFMVWLSFHILFVNSVNKHFLKKKPWKLPFRTYFPPILKWEKKNCAAKLIILELADWTADLTKNYYPISFFEGFSVLSPTDKCFFMFPCDVSSHSMPKLMMHNLQTNKTYEQAKEVFFSLILIIVVNLFWMIWNQTPAHLLTRNDNKTTFIKIHK